MSDRAGVFVVPGARSTSDILRDVGRDLQELLRSEVRLAKVEVTEQANRAKSAGALIGGRCPWRHGSLITSKAWFDSRTSD